MRPIAFMIPIVLWCAIPPSALADELDGCRFGIARQERRVNGFLLQIERVVDPDLGCRAQVKTPKGSAVLQIDDWDIRFNEGTGRDINGDGRPDAVFEGYSGGAHCCWTYWIVSLDEPAGLLRKICNQRPAQFKDLNGDHRIEIITSDGAFDYFDDLSHAYSPFPRVVLQLEGRELNRINEEFWASYAQEIAEARKRLNADQIRRFRNNDRESAEWLETKRTVLTIVLAFLYGGRESEAWEILGELWPSNDVKRIQSEILKTAKGGFLGSTRRPSYGCWE